MEPTIKKELLLGLLVVVLGIFQYSNNARLNQLEQLVGGAPGVPVASQNETLSPVTLEVSEVLSGSEIRGILSGYQMPESKEVTLLITEKTAVVGSLKDVKPKAFIDALIEESQLSKNQIPVKSMVIRAALPEASTSTSPVLPVTR